MKKEYRAGIYLRISKENMHENNSIKAQREITTKYARDNGYKIIKEYEDNGYSGILNSRPGLNEMIIDITRGLINMVIVKDLSRLTRDKNKTGWYTEIFFPDNDIRFISVTEFIDSGERYQIDDTIALRGIANQYYIADISKKIRSNKKAMKENGKYVEFFVPYGYKKKEEDIHEVIIDKKVENIVKLIFDMYIEGNSCYKIATYLNNKNVISPSTYLKMKNESKEWSKETVNSILSNQFYCGDMIMNRYNTNYITKVCKRNKDNLIIKENAHPAIISKIKYTKVQEIKNSKIVQQKEKHDYLLKSLLYCGHCKLKYQYRIEKSANKKDYLYNSSRF